MVYRPNKILIVDGYNVLRSGHAYIDVAGTSPNFEDWTSDDYNKARAALLNDIALYVDKSTEAYVVFDAKANKYGKNKRQSFGKIHVIFSPFGKSADTVIESLCHDAYERGYKITVVTNDRVISDTVFRHEVTLMGTKTFCSAIRADDQLVAKIEENKIPEIEVTDASEYVQTNKPEGLGRVENMIDSKALKKLQSLLDDLS